MRTRRPFVTAALVALAFVSSGTGSLLAREDVKVAQALSNKCATPAGICLVGFQPIGSPCFCGRFGGVIVP